MFWTQRRKTAPTKRLAARRTRLGMERLEDRIVPATYVWSGVAGGLWSDNTNWTPNGLPGAGDTVTFNATNNNNSTEDLSTRLGKLVISGYTGTISLKKQLIVDVLTMSSGVINRTGWDEPGGVDGSMWIRQDNADIYGASSWTGGSIGGGDGDFTLHLVGSADHPLTFNVDNTTSTPTFAGNTWYIHGNESGNATDATVNWNAGNLQMIKPPSLNTNKIVNNGTFNAKSTGKITNNNANRLWKFVNMGDLFQKSPGQFENVDLITKGAGKTKRLAGLGGPPGTFTVVGNMTQEDDAILQIESGTIAVVATADGIGGTFTMTGGTITAGGFGAATGLSVEYAFTQSAGTASFSGTAFTADVIDIDGGTLRLRNYAVATAANGLDIASAATLAVNSSAAVVGHLTNNGTVDLRDNANSLGLLSVTGDYTQVSGAQLKIGLGGAYTFSKLQASAEASIAGTIDIATVNGYTPSSGADFYPVVAGALDLDCVFAWPTGTWGWEILTSPDELHIWKV